MTAQSRSGGEFCSTNATGNVRSVSVHVIVDVGFVLEAHAAQVALEEGRFGSRKWTFRNFSAAAVFASANYGGIMIFFG